MLIFVSSVSRAEESPSLNNQLQGDMKWALSKYHLAGMSLSYAIGQPSNTITLVQGYANIQAKMPVKPSTYFQVGSITKAFISSILMRQVEVGKITLDEKLKNVAIKYPGKNNELLNIVNKYPYLGEITIRQFLNHSSGIPESINTQKFMNAFNRNPTGYWDARQLIAIAMSYKPYFKPGEKDYYGYTNTDYIIIGVVIEALTGRSIVDEMQRFLSGLGLDNIYFLSTYSANIPKKVLNQLAHAYILKSSQLFSLPAFKGVPVVIFPEGQLAKDITFIALAYSTVGAASGGMIATTPDLIKWCWLLFHGKVVGKEYFPEMLKGVRTADINTKYGLAISIMQTKKYGVIYSHDGDVFGYDANLLYIPKLNLTLAVAVNTSTAAVEPVKKGVVGRILKTFARNINS